MPDDIVSNRQEFELYGRRLIVLSMDQFESLSHGPDAHRVRYARGIPCVDAGPVAEPTFPLVCEGACNPDIRNLDRRVRVMFVERGALTEGVLAEQRALAYTPHVRLSDRRYLCALCRTVRAYGGEAA